MTRVRALCLATLAWLTALATLSAGCERDTRGGDGGARALTTHAAGLWNAELRLTTTPRGPEPDPPRTVRGTIALLESRAETGRAWLHRPGTHTGVYDIDLRPFGFVPDESGPVAAIAAAVAAPDTLVIATPPGREGGTLRLLGVMPAGGDSIVGTWSYGTRAVSGWGGTFTLRARPPSAP